MARERSFGVFRSKETVPSAIEDYALIGYEARGAFLPIQGRAQDFEITTGLIYYFSGAK